MDNNGITHGVNHYNSFEEYCLKNPDSSEMCREVIRVSMEQGVYDFPFIQIDMNHPYQKKLKDGIESFLKRLNDFEERGRKSPSKLIFKTAA